jgi:hypothetical protein
MRLPKILDPIRKWFNPKIWKDPWFYRIPPLKWWFALDKHAGKPWYWRFKMPLTAHAIFGMGIPFGIAIAIPGCSLWGAWGVGVGVVFKGQMQKADALISNDWDKRPGYNVQNIIYRTLIAAVPWGLGIFLFG